MIDNSDDQYATIRNKLFILVAVILGQCCASAVLNRLFNAAGYRRVGTNRPTMTFRRVWSLIFSSTFLIVLLGSSFLKVWLLVTIGFVISKVLGEKKAGIASIWIYCVIILFLNYWYQGYQFSSISPALIWLDKLQGLGFRWYIVFNFQTLRMISFFMDKYWAYTKSDSEYSVYR